MFEKIQISLVRSGKVKINTFISFMISYNAIISLFSLITGGSKRKNQSRRSTDTGNTNNYCGVV